MTSLQPDAVRFNILLFIIIYKGNAIQLASKYMEACQEQNFLDFQLLLDQNALIKYVLLSRIHWIFIALIIGLESTKHHRSLCHD